MSRSIHHWLMKTEPEVFSIDDLRRKRSTGWDGVRNYEARNFMRSMAVGDRVLIYHSNATPPGIAGLAEVSKLAYPDHTQFDVASEYYDPAAVPANPRWWMVEVRFVSVLPRFLSRDELKSCAGLDDLKLWSRSRLSIVPVEEHHYQTILAM